MYCINRGFKFRNGLFLSSVFFAGVSIILLLVSFLQNRLAVFDFHSWYGTLRTAYSIYAGVFPVHDFSMNMNLPVISSALGLFFRCAGFFSFPFLIIINHVLLGAMVFMTWFSFFRKTCMRSAGLVLSLLLFITPFSLMLFRTVCSFTYIPFMFLSVYLLMRNQLFLKSNRLFCLCLFLQILLLFSHRSMLLFQGWYFLVYVLVYMRQGIIASRRNRICMAINICVYSLGGLAYFFMYKNMITDDYAFGVSQMGSFLWYLLIGGVWGGANFLCFLSFLGKSCINRFQDKENRVILLVLTLIPVCVLMGHFLGFHVRYQYFLPLLPFMLIGSLKGFLSFSRRFRSVVWIAKLFLFGLILLNNIFLLPSYAVFGKLNEALPSWSVFQKGIHFLFSPYDDEPLSEFPYYLKDNSELNRRAELLFSKFDTFAGESSAGYCLASAPIVGRLFFETYAVNRGLELIAIDPEHIPDEANVLIAVCEYASFMNETNARFKDIRQTFSEFLTEEYWVDEFVYDYAGGPCERVIFYNVPIASFRQQYSNIKTAGLWMRMREGKI